MCGAGTQRDEEGYECDGRDYFGKPVRVKVPTKDGRSVVLEGEYTGYGEVEVQFGGEKVTFYPEQFQVYWDCWDTTHQYVAGVMYCEDCMRGIALTSRAEFDLGDFTLGKDHMAKNKAPKNSMGNYRGGSLWGTALVAAPAAAAAAAAAAGGAPAAVAVPVAAAAAAAPAKKTKVVKVKAPLKEDLIKQVDEAQKQMAALTAEVERLKKIEARFKLLEAENNDLRSSLRNAEEKIDKARKALNNW